MKKICAQTRQALPNYLRGHLFKISKVRIERHLAQCVVCRSEFEALRRTEETRQILKDIDAPEGVVGRVREGVSSIRNVRKILYRPLWMLGIVLAAAAVYYYVVTPRQLDVEIERIIKTEPSASVPLVSGPAATTHPQLTASSSGQPLPLRPAASPARERLVITITADDDKEAIRRINDILREHGQLQKLKFSDSDREIGGSLIAKELVTFFGRISSVAKVSYSRKRLESFPVAEPVPFVMKLVIGRHREEPGSPAQTRPTAETPAGQSMSATPTEAPSREHAGMGSETVVPAPPKTAPSQTASP